MTVKIVSDSCCDLPKDIVEEYGVDILPIIVLDGEKEYLDKVDISPLQVYEGMKKGIVFKTAQVPAPMFEKEFKKIADSKESYIYIAFSSGLSGTYQTALLIKDKIKEENPNLDLEIIDSKSASIGQGLIVYKAAKMAKEGYTKEEIIEAINFYVDHMEHIVTVDNIDYLYRGGRVTRTEAIVGGLLNIKPIIHINEDGELKPIDKVRGRKKAINKMFELVEERGSKANLKDQVIGLLHTDDWETAEKLKERMIEEYGSKEFVINNVGAAIGAHSGPGTLSIFFLNEYYDK